MGRLVKGHLLEVQPGRVLEKPFDLDDFPRYGDRFEARKAIPYQLGDVVWSKAGRRALVIVMRIERTNPDDIWGSPLLPVVLVREETAKGEWSKQWVKMWPGDLDRGYDKWVAAQSAENA
ncbi:hypothetical protein RCXUPER_209 [Rhodobacter phage RcXuper]|nr:hypothetical protein RCXUPER_209 [Rhodobacter phage RcXuper]